MGGGGAVGRKGHTPPGEEGTREGPRELPQDAAVAAQSVLISVPTMTHVDGYLTIAPTTSMTGASRTETA